MADVFTTLEDRLDKLAEKAIFALSHRGAANTFDEYQYRIGVIDGIRDVGRLIREIRNPARAAGDGEIKDIIAEGEENERE